MSGNGFDGTVEDSGRGVDGPGEGGSETDNDWTNSSKPSPIVLGVSVRYPGRMVGVVRGGKTTFAPRSMSSYAKPASSTRTTTVVSGMTLHGANERRTVLSAPPNAIARPSHKLMWCLAQSCIPGSGWSNPYEPAVLAIIARAQRAPSPPGSDVWEPEPELGERQSPRSR